MRQGQCACLVLCTERQDLPLVACEYKLDAVHSATRECPSCGHKGLKGDEGLGNRAVAIDARVDDALMYSVRCAGDVGLELSLKLGPTRNLGLCPQRVRGHKLRLGMAERLHGCPIGLTTGVKTKGRVELLYRTEYSSVLVSPI